MICTANGSGSFTLSNGVNPLKSGTITPAVFLKAMMAEIEALL